MSRAMRGFLAVLGLAVAAGHLGVGYVVDPGQQDPASVVVGPQDNGPDDGGQVGQGPIAGPKGKMTALPTGPAGQKFECAAGRNGGSHNTPGVSDREIKLAATAALDGEAASLLAPVVTGLKVVIDKVNASGGICGRTLKLRVDNDSFDGPRGRQYIKNYIDQDIFALLSPSAEGLSDAINAGDIDKAGIPVVGTDGLRREQYSSPWVWPVGTATQSTMRIMADYASKSLGAKTFAIVWDSKYKFGIEGRDEFVRHVTETLGGKVVADQPLDPGQTSYATEVADFNAQCQGGKCDMVALLLLPDAAEKWITKQPEKGAIYTAGAQTLFTDKFAQRCVSRAKTFCHGISVWTGYNPPIDRYRTLPDIATYISDVQAVSPGADVTNQFLEGGYFGATLLVEALKRVGPVVTRERLRDALDSMMFSTDFASSLKWAKGNHRANVTSRAFSIVVANGLFRGWRDEQTGFRKDPKA